MILNVVLLMSSLLLPVDSLRSRPVGRAPTPGRPLLVRLQGPSARTRESTSHRAGHTSLDCFEMDEIDIVCEIAMN